MRRILLLFVCSAGFLLGDYLPQLEADPWTGWYCGSVSRSSKVGIEISGRIVLTPLKDRKSDGASIENISLTPRIQIVDSSGKRRGSAIKEDGWEAITPATDKASKVVFQGTTKDDIKFEITCNISSGRVIVSGKILESGSHNAEFSLYGSAPTPYVYVIGKVQEKMKEGMEKALKAAARDRYSFLPVKGAKYSARADDKNNAIFSKIGEAELKGIEVDYRGRLKGKLAFEASPGTSMQFTSNDDREIVTGFRFSWNGGTAGADQPAKESSFTMTWR